MANDLKSVLLTREEIAQKVRQIGREINADYRGEEIIVACVLRGGFVFCADLVRELSMPMTIEFLVASSYGAQSQSSGNVQIKKDFETDISGKHVLLVEDIVDSGLTLSRLKEMLMVRQPASLKICTLLNNPARRKVELVADYCGFDIPDEFVVGYGLDYAGHYRNLKDICILDESVYANH